MKRIVGFVLRVVLAVLVLAAGVATVMAAGSTGVVPGKYYWPVAVLWVLLSAVVAYGLFRAGRGRLVRTIAAGAGAVVLAVGAIFVIGVVTKFNTVLDNIQIPEVAESTGEDGEDMVPAETEKGAVSDAFVIYVSGIDVRTHDLPARARSDVNILLIVNPTTHKILTVTTPRDYYVEMPSAGYAKDKLTNIGNYGVGASVQALSNLYNVGIDYYVRVNFDTLIWVVDTIGGIDVKSEYAFSIDGYNFKEGWNNLNGKRALAFTRERKSFAEGDRVRGRHQQLVIEAIFQKMLKPDMLTRAGDIVDVLASSMQTNFGTENIKTMIRQQLDTMASWQVANIEVDGWEDHQPTYTSSDPTQWVMAPDWSTVKTARAKIAEAMK